MRYPQILLVIALCFTFLHSTYAQISIEKIVFTKAKGTTVATSVFITLKIIGTEQTRLAISSGDNAAVEVPLQDLDYDVVTGLVTEQVGKWYSDYSGDAIDSIFDINALVKMKELVNEGLVTRGAFNTGPKTVQESIFKFHDSLSFYITTRLSSEEIKKGTETGHIQVQPFVNNVAAALDWFRFIDSNKIVVPDNVTIIANEMKDLQDENKRINNSVIAAEDDKQAKSFSLDRIKLLHPEDTSSIRKFMETINKQDSVSNVGKKLMQLNDTRLSQLNTRLTKIIAVPPVLDSFVTKKYKNKEYGRIYIDSLEVIIRDGFIKYQKIILNDSLLIFKDEGIVKTSIKQLGLKKEQFENIGIDLRNIIFNSYNLQKVLFLTTNAHFSGDKALYCFYLPDLITYSPPNDPSLIENFVPVSSRLIFSPGKKTLFLPETDINRIITMNIFSDVVGINEDKPNGLLQMEAKFFGNLSRNYTPRHMTKGSYSPVSYFEANFLLSKLENKGKYLELLPRVNSGDTTYYIHTFNLLQYQNMSMGVKLNLFKYADATHEGHLNIGVGTIRTGVRDSLKQSLAGEATTIIPHNFNIYSLKYYVEILYKLKAISRVGIDVTVNFIGVDLLDKKVKQSSGVYDPFDSRNNTFESKKGLKAMMFNPQLQVYYFASSDESQRIYGRLGFNVDMANKGNNFPTIQIGYAWDINKFLQFK